MKSILILIIFLFTTQSIAGEKWRRIIDLRGQWKFSLGDNMKWVDPDYDDDDWNNIFVPSPWEDEGYPGYDGYAWYRKKFRLNKDDANKNIYLRLWQIDDVDETYINGHSVGISGSFPPHYYTAYSKERNYKIPKQILFTDKENIISIRVYDSHMRGGIVSGKAGIYERIDEPQPEIAMDGPWKFMPGDNIQWKDVGYDDSHWNKIMVPSLWEYQGYSELEGYAWYRTQVIIPGEYKNKNLFLFLGRIDDLDQTYFNGRLIGESGSPHWSHRHFSVSDEYRMWRQYEIDEDLIRYGRENIIAVRVFDDHGEGGIYKGPVGIVTEKTLKSWNIEDKVEKHFKGFFEAWFKD